MFKEYNQNQTFLLPPNFKDFLWEWHEAIILSELIDELNLENLYKEYKIDGNWRPAYNPRMLLKVLFYWYMNQTFSSRKLAKKMKTDLWFMYVAWNNQPDFRTINRFRKERWKILEDIFIQIVLKAKDLWMIKFWTVSLDGTKIYANASKTKSYKIEDLDKKIKKLFEEANKIDEVEDKKFWKERENDIPEELKTKKWRDKKRKEIRKKTEKLESIKYKIKKEIEEKKDTWIKQDRINMTDKDSRLMMMKRKDRWSWYNPQNLTENQFILTTMTPNSAEDTWELKPILEKFKKRMKDSIENLLADKGYASEENYEYLEKENIDWYIPHQENKVDLKDYIYDKKRDKYEDKEWNIYKFKQNVWKKKKETKGRPKWGKKLKKDEIKSKIYVTILESWIKKFLCISKNWQELCKRNDDRLYSEKWKEIYKKRSWCVENVFWNIKKNLWFEGFLLRWFEWVQIEWNLICLAHNLKKIMKFQAL